MKYECGLALCGERGQSRKNGSSFVYFRQTQRALSWLVRTLLHAGAFGLVMPRVTLTRQSLWVFNILFGRERVVMYNMSHIWDETVIRNLKRKVLSCQKQEAISSVWHRVIYRYRYRRAYRYYAIYELYRLTG